MYKAPAMRKKNKMIIYFDQVNRTPKTVVSFWVTISCYSYPAKLPLHTAFAIATTLRTL